MNDPHVLRLAGRSLKTGMFSSTPVDIDIRRFVNPKLFWYGFEPLPQDMSFDDKVWSIQKRVVKFLIYGPDTFWGAPEHFLLPEETIAASKAKCGVDCEDGANLILSCCLAAGIPRERIWCSGGPVVDKGKEFGHGYVVYVRDGDSIPVVIDWCFYEDSAKPPNMKIPYTDNSMYLPPWFSWDHEECWVDTNVKLFGRIRNVVV